MSKANQQNKKSLLITEEDKTSNPIFNAIYKKIRNLNKKLTNIELLQKQPVQTLKEEQIIKIQRKIDTVNQIKKNQEFALFYKNILQENGGVVFDTSDVIIKISTLLAVGQHAQKSKSIPKDLKKVYENSYQKATQYKDTNVAISDRIVDIFNSLNDFVKADKNYEVCKNYISFLPEQKPDSQILQVQSKIQEVAQKVQTKQKAPTQTIKYVPAPATVPVIQPVQEKPAQKLQQQAPKIVVQTAKVTQTELQKTKKSWIRESDDDDDQNVDPVQVKKTEQKKEEPVKKQTQVKQQQKLQTLKQSSTNNGNKSNEFSRKQYKPRSDNYRRGNNQREGYNNYHHQNSRPYPNHQYDEQQYHKPRNNYQNTKYGDKKYGQPKNTRRKDGSGSDTSLEPTPQKLQKKQMVKYVQKK